MIRILKGIQMKLFKNEYSVVPLLSVSFVNKGFYYSGQYSSLVYLLLNLSLGKTFLSVMNTEANEA